MRHAFTFFRQSSLFIGLLAIAMTFGVAVVILDNEIAVAIVTAGTAIFVSIFSAIWARNVETTRSLEQQIRERKTPIYEEFVSIAFDTFWSNKENSPQEISTSQRRKKQTTREQATNDAVTRLQELTPQLIVWGTEDVIISWLEFRKISAESVKEKPFEVMFAFENFLSEIRKDLGHKNEVLQKGDLLRIFINDLDQHL